MDRNPSFTALEISNGILFNDSESDFPTIVHGLSGGTSMHLSQHAHFVYVHSGVVIYEKKYYLEAGMYGKF